MDRALARHGLPHLTQDLKPVARDGALARGGSIRIAEDSGYWISGLMAFDDDDLLKYMKDARPSSS